MMSIMLGVLTIVFAWCASSDRKTSVLAASGFAALYWLSQALAIVCLGTAFFDPQFDAPSNYVLGLPGQIIFQALFLTPTAGAAWFALRANAAWTPRKSTAA